MLDDCDARTRDTSALKNPGSDGIDSRFEARTGLRECASRGRSDQGSQKDWSFQHFGIGWQEDIADKRPDNLGDDVRRGTCRGFP